MDQDPHSGNSPRIKPLSQRTIDELLELVGTVDQPTEAAAWNDLRSREPDWKPYFDDTDLTKRCFVGFNLARASLLGCNVREASFEGTDLRGASLYGAYAFIPQEVAASVIFRSANLNGACFLEARLERADFDGAYGMADFTRAKLGYGTASGVRLEGSCFDRASLVNMLMHRQSRLTGCTFLSADLEGTRLFGSNLDGADFSGADIRRIQLMDASLVGAKLVAAVAHLAQFRDSKLDGADLSGASLRAADLARTDLSRACLRGADASNADFTGAIVCAATDFNGMVSVGAKLDEPVRALIAKRKSATLNT